MAVRVLRIDLEYDGTAFFGWTSQPGLRTLQGELTTALETIVRSPVRLAVAGRTDRGVHALGQVVSAETTSDIPAGRIERGLNAVLPDDIKARAVLDADPSFNARHDARSRRYVYRILVGALSPLRRQHTYYFAYPLDLDTMRGAAALVVGEHDFRAFTPTDTEHVRFERVVSECRWDRTGDELVMTIEADAFLRHMVRSLTGSMLMVGRGSRDISWFADLLTGRPRSAAGRNLPPHGLTLVDVRY